MQPTATHTVTEGSRTVSYLQYATTDKSVMRGIVYDFCQQALKTNPQRYLVKVVYAKDATLIGYTTAGTFTEGLVTGNIAAAANISDAWTLYLLPVGGFVVDVTTDTVDYLEAVGKGIKDGVLSLTKNLPLILVGLAALFIYTRTRR